MVSIQALSRDCEVCGGGRVGVVLSHGAVR